MIKASHLFIYNIIKHQKAFLRHVFIWQLIAFLVFATFPHLVQEYPPSVGKCLHSRWSFAAYLSRNFFPHIVQKYPFSTSLVKYCSARASKCPTKIRQIMLRIYLRVKINKIMNEGKKSMQNKSSDQWIKIENIFGIKYIKDNSWLY